MCLFGGSMKKLLCSLMAISLAGCASGPVPTYISGGYYLVGDKRCKQSGGITPKGTLLCKDKNGQIVDARKKMTQQDLQVWYAQRAQTSAEIQQLTSQLNQMSNDWAAHSARINSTLIANQNYNLSYQGGSNNVFFTRRGNTWLGSNGQAYHVVGNALIGPDGRTCRVVGSTILCN